MRLSRVKLDFAYKVPGSRMESAQYEISEDDVSPDGEKPGVMRYDAERDSLVFGQQGEVGVSWSHVVTWEGADLELVCDKCEGTFKSAQALGSHRRVCKGKAAKE
jgi:hypothetical protein